MPSPQELAKKRLFVFDLDGTLARSKTPMDEEMDAALSRLLARRMVAVIGGGWLPVFEMQLLERLTCPRALLGNLYLFPTSGSRFLRYDDGWRDVYSVELAVEERRRIVEAFEEAFRAIDYRHPERVFGTLIEDRKTQVTFSALGQQAPIELKDAWKGSAADRRREIVAVMERLVPEFEIKIPGKTSIDVTKKGIDKGYGVEQMRDHLGVAIEDMVFFGDALYEGGNDEPVRRTGILAVPVEGPDDTLAHLRGCLECL